MACPMGDVKLEPLRVDLDRRPKLEFHGGDIPPDGGLFPDRELDHALELTEAGGEVLPETRRGQIANKKKPATISSDDSPADQCHNTRWLLLAR